MRKKHKTRRPTPYFDPRFDDPLFGFNEDDKVSVDSEGNVKGSEEYERRRKMKLKKKKKGKSKTKLLGKKRKTKVKKSKKKKRKDDSHYSIH